MVTYCVCVCVCVVAGSENHTDCDCFAVAVLTHGDDGQLYGTDGIVDINNFLDPIKNCQSLAGKPKIFIFQVVFMFRDFQ